MSEPITKKISSRQMTRAMRLTVTAGGMATVWAIVCSPQAIFNVFLRNELGASASTLGALVGLIQLSGLFQLASIFIYGYSSRKKPFFVAAHLIHRLLTLAIAAGAFVAAARGDRSWGIRAIMVAVPLSWVFMNASAAGWWSWVADLFPENIRGSFFLKRSAIINVINVVWFFLASMFLDLFHGSAALWVYGIIFSIGAVSGIVDILLNLFIPEPVHVERGSFAPMDALEPLKNSNFIRFSIAVGIAIFSINLIAPFQAPYLVDPSRIGAPKTWLGIMFVISQLTWVFTAPFWGTVMDKWGRKPVVVVGCMFVFSWIGYLFITPRTFIYLLPLMSIAGGLVAPAFWEGVNQMMLSLAPNRNRIAYVAWYMTIVGVVSAGGSLSGGFLLDSLAGLSFRVGRLAFGDFHAVQLLSIFMVLLSAIILSRVREGRERPLGFVLGRVANPGILKTYAYLDYIASAIDPGRAEQALRSIEAQTGDLALDEILARLDDPYPEIREEAARALGRIGSPLAVEPLIERLEDRSSSLRIAAVRALGRLRDSRALEPLAGILSESTSEDLLEACLHALGSIGGDRATALVLDYYKDASSDRLRAAAGIAASRLGMFDGAQDIFVRFVSTRNRSVRRNFAIALGNLLGTPGDFYRYVTGSETGIADRVSRLFGRLEWKLKAIVVRAGGADNKQALKLAADDMVRSIKDVRDACEAGEDEKALLGMMELARRLFRDIFGNFAQGGEVRDLAFRVDPRLGAFAWLVETSSGWLSGDAGLDTCLDGSLASEEDTADVRSLLVLLMAYFLDMA
jgi:MFS family permease